MIVEKNISKYIVLESQTILVALDKIDANQSRIIFVVEESGVLIGSVSDGDVRRWVIMNPRLSLDRPVLEVVNTKCIKERFGASAAEISKLFKEGRDVLPLIDILGRIVAVAKNKDDDFRVGKFLINDKSPAFIVAEIGNNHNGSLSSAKLLVDASISAGADCVKFQMRNLKTLYTNRGAGIEPSYDLGAQYTLSLLTRFQLSAEEFVELFKYCSEANVLALCTPWDAESVDALEEMGIQGYKIASADLTNNELLAKVALTGKPMIVSTGMSSENEIKGERN
jgi:N-acetylneuraminate synthase